jgi:hypothetical protein
MNDFKKGSAKQSGDGLETGVMVAIILVSLFVAGLLAFVIVKKRGRGGDHQKDQNAAIDPSQALNLEADGSGLSEAVKGLKAHSSDAYDLEAIDGVSVEVDHERPKTPTYASNGHSKSSNGVGHSRII